MESVKKKGWSLRYVSGDITADEKINNIAASLGISCAVARLIYNRGYTDAKSADAYLCRDALAMEKHVSSLYNTTIFEFNSPVLRDTLNHIQKEEQNHGEQIYEYMSCNGMAG